jgi:S1-C subfamily serine protease
VKKYAIIAACAAVSAATILFVSSAGSCRAQALSIPTATILTMQRSLVAVECVDVNAAHQIVGGQTFGTGFLVDRASHFVTAGHVLAAVAAAQRQSGCLAAVAFPAHGYPADYGRYEQHVVFIGPSAYDGSLDLAVVAAAGLSATNDINAALSPVRFALAFQPQGTPLAYTGFARGIDLPTTSEGIVSTYTNDGIRQLVIAGMAWPGLSGSPVFLANGDVVGIVLSKGEPNTAAGAGDAAGQIGLSFARTAAVVDAFLRQRGIDPNSH